MEIQLQSNIVDCPSYEISSYIDGELDHAREQELEAHFSACKMCSNELNQQKQFLCGLDLSLKRDGDLELPPNFAKLIVTKAESNVSGLRRPAEVFNVIFVCVAFSLFVLFAAGSDAGKVLSGFNLVLDQIAAVGGVFGHLIYSVFLGVAIILRSLAVQFRVDVIAAIVITALLFASTLLVSRKMLRMRRA